MATKMLGVFAGLAIAANFACAPNGGEENISDTNGVCLPGETKADCALRNGTNAPDGGTPDCADAGTPDGAQQCMSLYTQQPVQCSGLNIQYVRRAINGRYTVQGIKVSNLEAAACTEWVYPVTEFCLLNSLETESGVLPGLSTSGCMTPLDENGKCTDDWRRRDQIWLCDCNKIVSQTNDAAWPGTPGFLEWCKSFNHPSRADCDEGGVVVESFLTNVQGGGSEGLSTYYKFLAKE